MSSGQSADRSKSLASDRAPFGTAIARKWAVAIGDSPEAVRHRKGCRMLRWALMFLLVALIAGFFGFWNLEGTAMWIARVLCFLFLAMFIVSLLVGTRAPEA